MDREKILLSAQICIKGGNCTGCPLCDVESRCEYEFAKFIVDNFPHIKQVSDLIGDKNRFCNLYEKEKKHSENLEKQIEILESQIENPLLTRWDAEKPPEKISRAYILDTAKKMVTGKREQDYGSPEDNFNVIGKYWSIYKGIDFSAEDVAIMMAFLKTARIQTGTATIDSWIDLAGYAACGGEIACGGGEKK